MGGILLMVLLDVAVHLVYELPYRCHYAHRHLARLGSLKSWSPRGADRAALSSGQLISKPVDAHVPSTRLVPTMKAGQPDADLSPRLQDNRDL